MKRSLVSTTSALALLIFGGGRVSAAPMAAPSDPMLLGTTDQTDVVRESLSLGSPAAPLIAGVTHMAGVVPDRPTIADPSAQTPSATFTYRPAVTVRGDSGVVGTIAANSRRNPGNVSNLRGTIASLDAGIFSVPATGILVNEAPARAYNYSFRPIPTLGALLVQSDSTDIVPREAVADNPGHSAFIGVRPPVPEADTEAAARRVPTLSATGSATPTVVIAPLPAPNSPAAITAASLGYQMDAGLATTIGFSTREMRPTVLRLGSAATSTLGYTYVPFGRRPAAGPSVGPFGGASEPLGATLSATITAPDGGPARRDWWTIDPAPDLPPASVSSVGAGLPLVRGIVPDVAADTFVVARDGPGGGRAAERVTIPILIKGELAERRSVGGSLLSASEAAEVDDETSTLSYGLAAAAVLVPAGLTFLGFRMVRRAALRRLTG